MNSYQSNLKVSSLCKHIISVCQSATESKVSASLMAIAPKSSAMKSKICVCLNTIIIKLDNKFSTFKDNDKIISMLGQYINEGSLELRQIAKECFISLTQAVKYIDYQLNGI